MLRGNTMCIRSWAVEPATARATGYECANGRTAFSQEGGCDTHKLLDILRLILMASILPLGLSMRPRNPVLNAAPRVHFPLARLALCLDCDACFEIGFEQCPACGSRTWSSLSRFIALQGEDLEPALLATRSTEISREPFSSVA